MAWKFFQIVAALETTESGLRNRLSNWHKDEHMSCNEIAERILAETGIRVSRKQIWCWLTSWGIFRSHSQAMLLRYKSGRMVHKDQSSKIAGRVIDYRRTARYPSHGRRRLSASSAGKAAYHYAQGLHNMVKKGDAARLHRSLLSQGHDYSFSSVYAWIRGKTKVPPPCQQPVAAFFGLATAKCFPTILVRSAGEKRHYSMSREK